VLCSGLNGLELYEKFVAAIEDKRPDLAHLTRVRPTERTNANDDAHPPSRATLWDSMKGGSDEIDKRPFSFSFSV